VYKKRVTIGLFAFLLSVMFMVSPAFADDYIYTNKDLEKYRMPSQSNLQSPGDPADKNPQVKKVIPARKKHSKEKPTQYIFPSKNRKKQTKCQDTITVWPQNVTTQ